VEAILKRKYREAMRAANRARDQQPDDDAEETRKWFDEWAARPLHHEMREQPKDDFHVEMMK
jgi:hypothetical protein